MVHCFEVYIILWKTPQFVQSKIPQAIRAIGLVTFSPIILAAILHIQYANLRCVTLDEFKQPLWKYRLNVLAIPINFISGDSGFGFLSILELGDNWMYEDVYMIGGKGGVIKGIQEFHAFQWGILLSSPLSLTAILHIQYANLRCVTLDELIVHGFELYLIVWKTPKFVESKIPQAIRAVLAIPINWMTQDGGLGFSNIAEWGENWMDANLTILGDQMTGRDQFLCLVWFSPLSLAAILHIQYANLRCVTLDEFKNSLRKYRLNVGLVYFFSVVSGLLYHFLMNIASKSIEIRVFFLLCYYTYAFTYVGLALKFSWDI
ncbi:unnamed protein product [Caenorhabditis auriculariae]|uniref:Uncharacterized protein n=1 Tax=Caenorhabditis auriculariae TaxID=2777116 RepID=A0A8S1GUC2_9PELO|nr:unnamed protein product [Caenorhabditis auriculariae]